MPIRQYSCNRHCLSQDFIMKGGIIKQNLKYFQVKTLSPVRLFVLQLTSSVMDNYVPVGTWAWFFCLVFHREQAVS